MGIPCLRKAYHREKPEKLALSFAVKYQPNNTDEARSPSQETKLASSCAPQGISPPRVISSQELLAGAKLLVIDHAGQQYRLTVTKNGKLILQK
jgi:hemin uptake protein HemP